MAYAKIQNTNNFFKEKIRKYKWIIKQLLNSVLVGYEELLRPRLVIYLSLRLWQITQTSALIIPHILLDLIQ